MEDKDTIIKDLEEKVSACSKHLEEVLKEQQSSGKLLIRRDLALSRANEQLQKLDEAKSEFISVAAHQLRTPLSAIKWILHMLEKNEFKDDKEKTEFTAKALVSTDRMISLVNDLLEVDHIQSGKEQFVFTKLELGGIISSVVSEFKTLADNKNIIIDFVSQNNINITGDAIKLRALFQNLIENSIKYTLKGGKVTIGFSTANNEVTVSIKDTGIGIPDTQSGQIFTKFFRAQNAMKLETVGSGLGLFIAKQVVDRHGGKLWFESTVGVGTTFFVTLPLNCTC